MRPGVVWSVLVSAAILLPTASAGSLTSATPPRVQTVILGTDDYEAFSVDVATTWSLVVGVEVQSGGSIDVYLTTQQGYADYINPSAPSFDPLARWTQERTSSYNKTVTESGKKFIILDNAMLTTSGANPTGPVTVKLYLGKSESSFYLGLLVILLVIVAIVALVLLKRRRDRQPAARPPPPPLGAEPPLAPPPPT